MYTPDLSYGRVIRKALQSCVSPAFWLESLGVQFLLCVVDQLRVYVR